MDATQQIAREACRELLLSLPDSELIPFCPDPSCLAEVAAETRAALTELLAGEDINARCSLCSGTALHHASNAELVRRLLAAGANINATDAMGETPLHWACAYNDVELVRLLLSLGADPHANRGLNGQTPVCRCSNAEIVHLLKAAGADLNAPDVDGDRPLHYADLDLTRALLAEGADVNGRNAHEQTPLFTADGVEKATLLLAAGADPNVQDDCGETPLSMAESDEMAELLLAHGATII